MTRFSSNVVECELRQCIRKHGRITFAHFMECALYHPAAGYYNRPPVTGATGDYFTSPNAHPAFGASIALFLFKAWELLGQPEPLWVMEVGAGDEQLANDILDYFKSLKLPFPNIQYLSVDRAKRPLVPANRQHQIRASQIPISNITGCIISNELLDAFPVHRFEAQDQVAREVYVTLDNAQNFSEVLDVPSSAKLTDQANIIASGLPNGTRWEINPGIGAWAAQVASSIDRGFILTIDYGDLAQNLYTPRRQSGTLATYRNHVQVGSPYQRVGGQDITAHVNFSDVISHGQDKGIRTLGFIRQAEFMQSFGLKHFMQRLRINPLTLQQQQVNMMGMRELMKPNGLGDFKVLIQEKGTNVARFEQIFQPSAVLRSEVMEKLPLPLVTPDHTSLFAGRYPHSMWEPEAYDLVQD